MRLARSGTLLKKYVLMCFRFHLLKRENRELREELDLYRRLYKIGERSSRIKSVLPPNS